MCLHPPEFTLFPYTTLFRSRKPHGIDAQVVQQSGLQYVPVRVDRTRDRCAGNERERRRTVVADVRRAERFADSGGETRLREERSEEHTSELQSLRHLVCRLL